MFKQGTITPGEPPGLLKLPHNSQNEPPVVTLIEYGPDCLEERTHAGCEELLPHLNNDLVTWINIDGFGDLSVLRTLGERFNLHPLALEDVLDTNQRPKVEQYDDYLFIVVKMLYLDKENEIGAEQVSMFLCKSFLITLQEEGEFDVFEPVRARIRAGKGQIRKAKSDYLAYALIDSIIDHYYPVLESIGSEIDAIEDELVDHPLARPVGSLHEHKRTLTQIRRMVWPMRDVTNLLLHEEPGLIRPDPAEDEALPARLLRSQRAVDGPGRELQGCLIRPDGDAYLQYRIAHERDHARTDCYLFDLYSTYFHRGSLRDEFPTYAGTRRTMGLWRLPGYHAPGGTGPARIF